MTEVEYLRKMLKSNSEVTNELQRQVDSMGNLLTMLRNALSEQMKQGERMKLEQMRKLINMIDAERHKR